MRTGTNSNSDDNNFNGLRFFAAMAVVLSHSFTLATGNPLNEPLTSALGINIGHIAVDIFFVSSGFLVTSSLLRSNTIGEFLLFRALRVFPALWTLLIITVFLIGPLLSSLSAIEYFSKFETYKYLIQNAILIFGANYYLPGFFETAPYPMVVNGSLWSLPIEIRMYLILACIWAGLSIINRKTTSNLRMVAWVVFLSCTVIAVYHYVTGQEVGNFFRLGGMFFSGVLLKTYKEKIIIPWWGGLLLVLATVVAAADTRFFLMVYSITSPFLVIFVAHCKIPVISNIYIKDDVSYGVYVYSFPVQQIIVLSIPGVAPINTFLYSALVTLPIAFLSWRLVESKILKLKGKFRKNTPLIPLATA
ncbi:hypothetical protein PS900_04188 [Pseudomonas fluorescens]|uniref:Acyltransferase 3 domain-containing protein n=1 Tax=Pseudomonas fluorescens TaxID=294 RepID=A0A8H2RJ31_PSEFL|nr:acyltransferase [Pseudomonas fluorescens]VVP27667.1 hypothetical protein PS900_04188 [Pseudomonas fluorescens]